MRGLELYGKGWKKIASLVKTRTVVQIRTHAQKYFLKMSKARQSGEQASHHSQGKGAVSGISKVYCKNYPDEFVLLYITLLF